MFPAVAADTPTRRAILSPPPPSLLQRRPFHSPCHRSAVFRPWSASLFFLTRKNPTPRDQRGPRLRTIASSRSITRYDRARREVAPVYTSTLFQLPVNAVWDLGPSPLGEQVASAIEIEPEISDDNVESCILRFFRLFARNRRPFERNVDRWI